MKTIPILVLIGFFPLVSIHAADRTPQWIDSVGAKGFDHTMGAALVLADGSIIAAGTVRPVDTISPYYGPASLALTRVDSSGTVRWSAAYDSLRLSSVNYLAPIGTTAFGVAGKDTGNHLRFILIDTAGRVAGGYTLNSVKSDSSVYLCPDGTGGLAFAGYAAVGTMTDAKPVVALVNQTGEVTGAGDMSAFFSSIKGIVPAPDSGFFVVGILRAGTNTMVCAKMKPDLDTVWTEKSTFFVPSAVAALPDGGCLVIGAQNRSSEEPVALKVQRYSAGGSVDWENDYVVYIEGETKGLITSNYFYGKAVVITGDTGIVISGTSMVKGAERGFIIRLQPSGVRLWSSGRYLGGSCTGVTVVQTLDGGYCAGGLVVDSQFVVEGNSITLSRLLLVKYAADGTPVCRRQMPSQRPLRRRAVYQGKNSVQILLDRDWNNQQLITLYSLTGRAVQTKSLSGSERFITFSGLTTGIYVVQVKYTGRIPYTHYVTITN